VSAGICGPAAPGSDGLFLFDLGDSFAQEAEFPYPGTWVWNGVLNLKPEQMTNLENGLLYINITSSNFPSGEWRGQILSALEPTMVTNINGVPEPGGNFVIPADPGANFAFLIYAWGKDLSYQWMLNGHPIDGATGDS
jgi:hypothetical protein